MRFEVVTLFPEMIRAYLQGGVVGRAVERGLIEVGTEDPRSHATDVHRTVDDRAYGGGPGMVLKAEPMSAAIGQAVERLPPGCPVVGLCAQGPRFDQARARELARLPGLVLVAGRYEGFDQRLLDRCTTTTVSVGDYVLSGGELPALVVIDAVARLLPGVLGDQASAVVDSYSDGLLDWPQYTRPESWHGDRVPEVLLSGDHAAIRRWRLKQALGRSWQRRPDLIEARGLGTAERELLEEFCRETGIAPPRRVN